MLCASDLQLGAGRTLGITLDDQERWLAQIVEHAESCDLVLLCGDAFEHRQTNRDQDEVFMRFLVSLARECPVLLVGGNHDWRGYERASTVGIFREIGVTVALEPGLHRFGLIGDEVEVTIAALPWASLGHLVASQDGGDRDRANALAAEHLVSIAEGLRARVEPGETAILAAHWAVTGASLPTGLPVDQLREPVIEIGDLAAQRWDAIALGHVHKAQLIDCDPPAFYCGSPYPCDWGEADDEHGVWIVEPDPATQNERERALYVPRFVPLEGPRFVKIGVDADEHPSEPGGWVYALEGDNEGAIVRVSIYGSQENARQLDRSAMRVMLSGARHVVFDESGVEKPERARVSGLTEELDELESLDLYIGAHDFQADRAQAIRERTRSYLDRVKPTERGLGGGFDPVRLRAKNFRTLADLDLDFREGAWAISGPNGAGKSSVLMALDVALFGARSLREYVTHGEEEMFVELTFRSGGEVYRIRRSFSAKGRGKSATDLEWFVGDEAEILEGVV